LFVLTIKKHVGVGVVSRIFNAAGILIVGKVITEVVAKLCISIVKPT
jgi:hypothetical protein